MIGVIDYKAGNGPSVKNALDSLGIQNCLTADKGQLETCSHIILPGVGSAGATMESLRELGLIDVLERHALEEHKPFFGICVGLQVLFEHSEEDNADCLGWLKGDVVRFSSEQVRVPQIGWNSVKFAYDHPIWKGLENEAYFYFVNSYHIRPQNPADVLGYTDYGGEFASIVAHGNIIASQFHIEKSGPAGLTLLKNFTQLGKEEPGC